MQITDKQIRIVSGEGNEGVVENYFGKLTQRAIKSRLTKEKCNGDRWARAIQYSHDNDHGEVGINLETGYYASYPRLG